jgi:uncharacterized membrane protein
MPVTNRHLLNITCVVMVVTGLLALFDQRYARAAVFVIGGIGARWVAVRF